MRYHFRMSSIIVPAILVSSKKELEQQLLKARNVGTDVQIDLVDGHLVSPASWPFTESPTDLDIEKILEAVPAGMTFEIDLMVERPLEVLDAWIQAGATRVLLHLGGLDQIGTLISEIKKRYGYDKEFIPELLSLGIAINVETSLDLVEPFIQDISFVQFMGIRRIGAQGQPFAPEVLPKIAHFKSKHPEIPIQVDGGVTLESAPGLLEAGVSRLIIGSALWKSRDFELTYVLFQEMTREHGMFAS